MSLEEQRIEELARAHNCNPAAVRALLAGLREQAGASDFYVFWTSRGSAGGGGERRRTLLTFLTPDAALAFAQRNQLVAETRPRLRRLSLLQLLQAALREPSIGAILFVYDDQPLPPAGALPPGLRIERADLLHALEQSPTDQADTLPA